MVVPSTDCTIPHYRALRRHAPPRLTPTLTQTVRAQTVTLPLPLPRLTLTLTLTLHPHQATNAIKEAFPKAYLYDPTPVHKAMWRVAANCIAVKLRPDGRYTWVPVAYLLKVVSSK